MSCKYYEPNSNPNFQIRARTTVMLVCIAFCATKNRNHEKVGLSSPSLVRWRWRLDDFNPLCSARDTDLSRVPGIKGACSKGWRNPDTPSQQQGRTAGVKGPNSKNMSVWRTCLRCCWHRCIVEWQRGLRKCRVSLWRCSSWFIFLLFHLIIL